MFSKTARHPIRVDDPGSVRVSEIWPGRRLPVQVSPEFDGVDLAQWLCERRSAIEDLMRRHGGLLFRGFDVRMPDDFQRAVKSYSIELVEYTERSTPRSRVGSFLYTSTEYPADQVIPLHNENAYSHTWPQHIWFFCERCADSGGETSIADSREVYQILDSGLRKRFEQRGIRYVRNYSPGLGLGWQETFQTDSKSAVECYCTGAGIECEWKGSRLTTRQIGQATATHPVTGETVWFNQAHLFHATSLPPGVYRSLLATVTEDEFPRHSYYGDGAPFESEALDHIRDVFARTEERVRWRAGDVLLLDNMLVAHGRRPYQGPRRVLVSMARPYSAP
jgi:alpha-ketoglutarate-dependent taurine dioxygenase